MRHAVAALVLVGVVLAVGPAAAARDHKPPRITAAVMQDADGDFRADRVLLTYSERIRHGVDHDGAYPFTVAEEMGSGRWAQQRAKPSRWHWSRRQPRTARRNRRSATSARSPSR